MAVYRIGSNLLRLPGGGLSASPSGGGGGDGNDGVIFSDFSDYDFEVETGLVSFDVNSTLPNHGTLGGAIVTFDTATWWNGEEVGIVDMWPPTTGDRSSGIGPFDSWKNGTVSTKQINIRVEWQTTAEFCADTTELPKFFMVQTYPLLSTDTQTAERPMMFLAHMTGSDGGTLDIPNTLCLVPAQGTTRMFSSTNNVPAYTSADWNGVDPGTYQNCRQSMYWRATSGTDGAGNPIIPVGEIVVIEVRVNVNSTADEPAGLIGCRIYRRGQPTIERCCAWTWEVGHTVDQNFIAGISELGGGYYNLANVFGVNKRTRIGRRISYLLNYQPTVGRAWIGAPENF